MDITKLIRKLAKEYRIQNLFTSSREINGVQLFHNKIDFSKLQEIWISYLYFYNEIYQDISTKKITKDILKDIIYEDAYIYWKREKKEEKKNNKKDKKQSKKDLQIVFSNNTNPKENK